MGGEETVSFAGMSEISMKGTININALFSSAFLYTYFHLEVSTEGLG